MRGFADNSRSVPSTILGISAFYHDSAACLVRDGAIVAAAQEERFTRKRHDAAFPAQSIDFCLRHAGISESQIDYVVFYEKPFRKFERLLETYLAFAPAGFRSFAMAMPVWLKEKTRLRLPAVMRESLGGLHDRPIAFVGHHESHAASAFFPSPFDEAAILTLDGVGEWSTTTIGAGQGNRISLSREIRFPHSLGLLYSAFTYYCGFRVNSGEYKLMGLAPYGRPVYKHLITKHLIDLRPDGSFWLDMAYFNYAQGLTMTGPKFDELFGGPRRDPESEITQRHMDLAASIQAVTDDAMLAMGQQIFRETGQRQLVLAGGVALNCVANGRLLREGPFDDLWIQPAAGDAGAALGAALFVWHQLLEKPRQTGASDRQQGSLLGPRFSSEEICGVLDARGARYRRAADEPQLLAWIVDLLVAEKVVGWFHGRMEFGPRSLGARSILADARSPTMQSMLNQKIKFRESFRPFAPCVLQSEAHRWFDLEEGQESPYMLIVAPVADGHRHDIPAVTHVDGSARVQTVDGQRHPRFARLLEQFLARTECPVLVNTSFNVRGEPIVCSPQDAYRCFLATDMDALVLEDVLLLKTDVANRLDRPARDEHLAQFPLD
jgi:carbamoyltransferase